MQNNRNGNFTLGAALLLAVLLLGFFSALPTNPHNPLFYPADAQPQAQVTEWVKIDGRNLTYQNKVIYLRGVNMANINALGADIGTGNPNDVQTGQDDYNELARMGGNHVRFGMSFKWYQNFGNQFWAMLDRQVQYAKNAGLWFLPLMFTTPGDCYEGYGNSCPFWNSTSEQNQLRQFWVELVTRYKDNPTVIGIDPLNEPTPNRSPWSEIFWRWAEQVRNAAIAVNPNILVFIEAGSDAQFSRKLGANVVYQVHDYDPLALTHGANDWISIQCRSGGSYPGTMKNWEGENIYYNKNAFAGGGAPEANLRELYSIDWAEQNNVPLYIGEWGSQSACPGWDTFIRDKADLYNQWGLSWAYYSWRANPGNFDIMASNGAMRVQNQTAYTIIDAAFDGAAPLATYTATVITPTRTATITRTPAPATPTLTRTVTRTPTRTATATPTLEPTLEPPDQVEEWVIEGTIGEMPVNLTIRRSK